MTKTARPCRFKEADGVTEECPREACPFWEPGGAILEGRCAFDGLDLSGRRDVAEFLLRIRDGLRTVETDEEREASRFLFDA
jgi:hypothetical protein